MKTFLEHVALLCAGTVFLLVLFMYAPHAEAAVLRSGDAVAIGTDSQVNGDLYVAGNTVSLKGPVDGDVYVLGGTVAIEGAVLGDVVVLGGTVTVSGSVGDDVRVLGGAVTVAGSVGGDVVVIGGTLAISESAHTDGDILFYGGEATVSGAVSGAVKARADLLSIDAPVGSVDAGADTPLSLLSRASVRGDVTYPKGGVFSRDAAAQVSGVVHERAADSRLGFMRTHLTFWFISLFSALVSVLLFRPLFTEVCPRYRERRVWSALVGLAVLLLVPFACGLLLVSILGALAGALLLLVYLALLLFVAMSVPVFLGACIASIMVKKYTVNWLFATVGVVATHALLFIPLLGPLVLSAFALSLLGILMMQGYHRIWQYD